MKQPDFVWIVQNDEKPADPAKAFYVYHDSEFRYFPNHPAAVAWCGEKGLKFRTEWNQG